MTGWMPRKVHHAWMQRVRPDLATRIVPSWPYMDYAIYLELREQPFFV